MKGTVAYMVTKLGIGLAVMLIVGGCAGGGGSARPPQGEGTEGPSAVSARLELSPKEGSGVRGRATFANAAAGTRIELELRDLPEPHEIYLAHIHPGSCEDAQHGEVPGGERADHHGNEHGHREHAGAIGYPLDAGGVGRRTRRIEYDYARRRRAQRAANRKTQLPQRPR